MVKCYYDIFLKIKLMKNMNVRDSKEYVANIINKSLLLDPVLKDIHKKNQIKGYVFSDLHPIEKDMLYKKDKIYNFNINTIDFNTALRLKDVLSQISEIIEVNLRMKEFTPILNISSVAPVISVVNSQFLTHRNSINNFYDAINKNMLHKLRDFMGIKKEEQKDIESFIQSITIRNNKDIISNYKGTKLCGYSVDIVVKQDNISQILANLCLATGLGEKNSIGFGYCISNKGV